MHKPLFEIPTLRPRIGGRGGEVAAQRAPLFCDSVLARARMRYNWVSGGRPPRPPRKLGSRAIADVPRPRADARRCVVKARIVRMNGRGVPAARLHLAYIERDGVERDGSAGRLYGAPDELDRADLTAAIPGERHQFRFIVSPEDSVNLTRLVRNLMRHVEEDLGGVRLRWGAVNHYNTANPHAHVVVRGVSRDGRQVRIDREYISNWMRWQAQHVLTRELGPRLENEIQRRLDREITQERLTSIDHRLASVLGPDQTTDFARLALTTGARERRRIIGRLDVLETMRLAERTSPGSWRLAPGWQEALRDLGERNEIMGRIHSALGGIGDRSRYQIIDGRDDHPAIEGVLRRKGVHDDLRGDAYAVIETPRGQAAYVRIDPPAFESLAEGSIVRVAVERQAWAKPMDRVLEQVARESGGTYDPKAHLAALRQRPMRIGGKEVAPEAVVEANLRRLARLERHNMVLRIDGGCWRVPSDLVAQLEARELTHPRRAARVSVLAPSLDRQVHARGPSWLDEQDPGAPRAPYGLGADVSAAMRERDRFLARLGIPREPREQRQRALATLERADVGRRLAADLGVTALAAVPEGFRGRLVACGWTANGAALAYAIDDASRRLVVLPLPPEAMALVGRVVSLSSDARGKIIVRPHGREREI